MTAIENTNSALTTKESLLVAAKRIFAQKGYDGATVKDIADEAGVNISLVSYHFNGKENLFRACVQAYGENRLAAVENYLKTPQSVEDFRVRLTLYLEDYFLNAIRDQDTMMIMHQECMSTNPLTEDIFKGVFMKSIDKMLQFFTEARKKGILRTEIDPHYTVMVVMGAIIHAVRMDPMHEQTFKIGLKDAIHREKLVTTLMELVMGGARK